MFFPGAGLYGEGVIRAARLTAIEDLLEQHQVLSTTELADELGVSVVTVRRDLDDLDGSGRIERVFGGARLVGQPGQDRLSAYVGPGAAAADVVDEPFDHVLARNAATKRSLARAAAQLVAEGETVFLDIGTTTFELARALAGRRLTVVTASLGVVDVLGPSPDVELVVLGGDYNKQYRCTEGPSVVQALATLQIDRVFLGCSGISDRGMVRDTDAGQVAIKRAAVRCGAPVTLLADASKLPGVGVYSALDLALVDQLVTDADRAALTEHLRAAPEHTPAEILTA